jgi:hypothetical protein
MDGKLGEFKQEDLIMKKRITAMLVAAMIMISSAAAATALDTKAIACDIYTEKALFSFDTVEEFEKFIQSEENKNGDLSLSFFVPSNPPKNYELLSIEHRAIGYTTVSVGYRDADYVYNPKLDDYENHMLSTAVYSMIVGEFTDEKEALDVLKRFYDGHDQYRPLYLGDMLVYYYEVYGSSENIAHAFHFVNGKKHAFAILPAIDGINKDTFKEYLQLERAITSEMVLAVTPPPWQLFFDCISSIDELRYMANHADNEQLHDYLNKHNFLMNGLRDREDVRAFFQRIEDTYIPVCESAVLNGITFLIESDTVVFRYEIGREKVITFRMNYTDRSTGTVSLIDSDDSVMTFVLNATLIRAFGYENAESALDDILAFAFERVVPATDTQGEEYEPLPPAEPAPIGIFGSKVENGDFARAIIAEVNIARSMTEEPHRLHNNYDYHKISDISEFYLPGEINGYELLSVDIYETAFIYYFAPSGERFPSYHNRIEIWIGRPGWESKTFQPERYLQTDALTAIAMANRGRITEDGFVYFESQLGSMGVTYAQTGDTIFYVATPPSWQNYDVIRDLTHHIIATMKVFDVDTGESWLANPLTIDPTVDFAVEILCYVVGLPSELDTCPSTFVAALIVSEDEPTADDALEILKYVAGLPSALD